MTIHELTNYSESIREVGQRIIVSIFSDEKNISRFFCDSFVSINRYYSYYKYLVYILTCIYHNMMLV